MGRWIRRIVLAVLVLLVLVALALAVGRMLGERKAARRVNVQVAEIAIPTGTAAIERGRYLFASRGCTECHGADGTGRPFINSGPLFVRAPNITTGPGSAVLKYTVVDWVRSIRHGVNPEGRPLFVMPSEDYNRLSDADTGALIAYLQQMPPASGAGFEARISPLLKTMYAAGLIRDAAEKINHALPPAAPVQSDGSAAHGAYVAQMCIGCHGERLSGGKIPGAPPEWPAAANLTPGAGSSMTRYADATQFIAMLRTGRRPDNSTVSPVMPFGSLRELSDTDARALYAHLKQLPALAMGGR